MKVPACTIVLLVLLLMGVAEAQQDIYTDCVHRAPDGTTYDICRMPDLNKILRETSEEATKPNPNMWYGDPQLGVTFILPCEKKMKEAMKLIRPYIDYGEVGTTTDLLYRSPQTKLREEADRLDKRDAAIRKWEAIYKECVK